MAGRRDRLRRRIRDEGLPAAALPKAGPVGFSVSNLRIPGFEQPWEQDFGKPERIVTALDIMTEGPLGGAAFNNESGRPALLGYFRTYEERVNSHNGAELRGYHKPIMLAGGIGNIRADHVQKGEITVGAKLVVLGGPAMNIGTVAARPRRWRQASPMPIWTSLRCSATTRKWSAAVRSDRPLLAAGRPEPDPVYP